MNNYTLDSNAIFITDLFGEMTAFSIQSVTMPGLTIGYQKLPSRREVIDTVVGFENLEFPPIILTLILDETLQNWLDFVKLILDSRKVENFMNTKDGILLVRGNNGQNGIRIVYANLMVTNVSDIEFSTTGDNTEQIFSVELQYDWFDVSGKFATTEGEITVAQFEQEIAEAYENNNL